MSAETAPHRLLTLRVGVFQEMAKCGQLPGKIKETQRDSGLAQTRAPREPRPPLHAGTLLGNRTASLLQER